MREKESEYAQERGIETLYLGLGMITWTASDGGRDPRAPIVFVPVEILDDPKRRGELARAMEIDEPAARLAPLHAMEVTTLDITSTGVSNSIRSCNTNPTSCGTK